MTKRFCTLHTYTPCSSSSSNSATKPAKKYPERTEKRLRKQTTHTHTHAHIVLGRKNMSHSQPRQNILGGSHQQRRANVFVRAVTTNARPHTDDDTATECERERERVREGDEKYILKGRIRCRHDGTVLGSPFPPRRGEGGIIENAPRRSKIKA